MNKQLEKLLKLSQENPELEIKIMVDYEVCASDDHNYWIAEIAKIEICRLWIIDEYCYIDDEIEEKLYDEYDEMSENGMLFEEYKEKRIKEITDNKDLEKIIAVYVSN